MTTTHCNIKDCQRLAQSEAPRDWFREESLLPNPLRVCLYHYVMLATYNFNALQVVQPEGH